MAMRAEYDAEADALYVRFSEEPVARTLAPDHAIAIDVGRDDGLVGLEILSPERNLERLTPLADQFGFRDRLAEIGSTIGDALGPRTYAATIPAGAVFLVASHAFGSSAPVAMTGSVSIANRFSAREVDASGTACEPVG